MLTTFTSNWWQILVASFVYFALGGFWYSPLFLGTKWAQGHGVKMDPELRKNTNMAKLFTLSMLCTVLLSLLVAHLCIGAHSTTLTEYLQNGVLVGLAGFAAMSMGFIYLQKPAIIFWIDGAYHIIGSLLASTIYFLVQL